MQPASQIRVILACAVNIWFSASARGLSVRTGFPANAVIGRLFVCAVREAGSSEGDGKVHPGARCGCRTLPLDRIVVSAGKDASLCQTVPDPEHDMVGGIFHMTFPDDDVCSRACHPRDGLSASEESWFVAASITRTWPVSSTVCSDPCVQKHLCRPMR